MPKGLRQALDATPDNMPLLSYAAEQCAAQKQWDVCEKILRYALKRESSNVAIQVSLARSFLEQQKATESLVIVEDIISRDAAPAEAFVLHARLLLRGGDFGKGIDHADHRPQQAEHRCALYNR